MTHHVRRLLSIPISLAFLAAATSPAASQGTPTSTLSGIVVDSSSSPIPGANVVVRNNATGGQFTAESDERGSFSIPALDPGTYSVTIMLAGFKQVVLTNVALHAATPASVRATLELGGLEETIEVAAGAEILQTQSSAVATTMNVKQISSLPLVSRNAIDFVTFLPGVSTPGTNRDSIVNGLPQGAINITVDGMNVQDNYLKTTDGFFARMSPRLDAVEEVTVTTAGGGAESAGQGTIQIRFITRSGTNELHGSAYEYFRHDRLNSNTWFNNRDGVAKAELLQNQPGVRVGGPIVIPGLWNGRNKAFFFVNYEELRQPNDVARNRTIMASSAQAGVFRYRVTTGGATQVREVDLLALAARNGQLASLDPSIAKVLADIRSATTTTGAITELADPNLQRYRFLNPSESRNRYPTVRLDFNLSNKHRLTGSYNYNKVLGTPDITNNRDPAFPGFPVTGPTDSDRYTTAIALRSTLSANVVNELRVGATGGASLFVPNYASALWEGDGLGAQGGYRLSISEFSAITDPSGTGNATFEGREGTTRVLEDNVSWIKGAHNLGFGFSFTQVGLWLTNQTIVPTINFGLVNGDPAMGLFTRDNLPDASNTDLTNAQNLYAVLTGRVRQITGDARIDENTGAYTFLGKGTQRGRMRELGFYAQDSWRVRQNLTVNYGVRYELQLPYTPLNNSYSTATVEDVWGISGVGHQFQPGVMTGRPPVFSQFAEGTRAYHIDWNNLAPNLGFAWSPKTTSGVLHRLLRNETVFRGGWSLAYERNGMSDFSAIYGANPGVAITANRSQALGNLGTVPVLLRDRDRLGPPPFVSSPSYPFSEVVTGDVNIFDPNLEVPYAISWHVGGQRAIGKKMAVDVRYVAARHLQGWTTYNYNEVHYLENGFLDEFRQAQANLQANLAAGRGANFRYFGPGTNTSPLPIMLAYFSGLPASAAGNASSYASTSFQDNLFLNTLAAYHPNPCCATTANANPNPSFAFSLFNNATFAANALRAGLTANFFMANPDLRGGANITGNGGYTKYNSLQVSLQRRYAEGLFFDASYVFGKAYESRRYSFREPRVPQRNAGADPGDITHAIKANWVYELPFGRGRAFGEGVNGFIDRVIGGWSFGGTARIQSGRLMEFGNVRLVGMSPKELQKAFSLRFREDGKVFMLPQDIIDNTVKAFSVSATSSTGYGPLGAPAGRYLAPANGPDCIETVPGFGDCGVRSLVLTGPLFQRYDLAIVKQVPIAGRVKFEFRGELLNALNATNFTPVTGISTFGDTPFGSNPDTYEVTAGDSGRIIQLVTRVSW